MKPLRLILPITLFILSGVLAWVGSSLPEGHGFISWCMFTSFFSGGGSGFSLIWSLGGFDD